MERASIRAEARLRPTFSERLKYAVVPPSLYIRHLVAAAPRRGEREIALVPYLADPERGAVDIGANKGVYAYALHGHVRRVVAFEPNPRIHPVLVRNMRGCGNVEVQALALSDRDGSATLRIPWGGRGHSNQRATLGATWTPHENDLQVTVETRRLDALGLSAIGFMKIDVEGHERAVLEGARETIARDRPTLLVEIEEGHSGIPIEEMLGFVESLGYRGLFLSRGGQLASLDAFDPETHHRSARESSRTDYVYNFIFLPREAPPPA